MVSGGGATGIVGVSVEILHEFFCGCEHCILDMVKKECDGLEGSFEEVGTEETIADQMSNSAGVKVNRLFLFGCILLTIFV